VKLPEPILQKALRSNLTRLEREGLLRRADVDLLRVAPIVPRRRTHAPSILVSEGRTERTPR
jgi:hypothetical protein